MLRIPHCLEKWLIDGGMFISLSAGRVLLLRNIIFLLLVLITVRGWAIPPGTRAARRIRRIEIIHSAHRIFLTCDLPALWHSNYATALSLWLAVEAHRLVVVEAPTFSRPLVFNLGTRIPGGTRRYLRGYGKQRGVKHWKKRLEAFIYLICSYRSGGPGSIPGTIRKKLVCLERGALSLVSTTEELLNRKIAAPV
jgi:hypothetical protein